MADAARDLIALLNQAISMEYGALFLLPQHIARVQDPELKRMLKEVETVELDHAEKTAELIFSLGGIPNADLPTLKPGVTLREILETHIDGERRSIDLYSRAARFARTPAARDLLDGLRRDEEEHLSMFTAALARLPGPAA